MIEKVLELEKGLIAQLTALTEKIKSADVEQIKIYLGFLYFAVLLFFSFTLFL